jgi:hypothetical protein
MPEPKKTPALDDKTREKFEELLHARASQRTEHAACLVDFIADKNDDVQVELFTILLREFGIPGKRNGIVVSGRKMDDERFSSVARTLNEMIHGTMRLIIHSRKSLEEAGRTLRDLVFSFDDVEQRDYCLSEIMNDEAVPYRPIPEGSLGELNSERLEYFTVEYIDAVAALRAVRRAGMETTAQAELTLKILEGIKDPEARVAVFEVGVIRHYLSDIQRLVMQRARG